MRLIHYVTSMILGTIGALSGLVFVVLFMDPSTGSWITIMLFYSSLFLGATGFFALLGLWLKSKFFRAELEIYRVKGAFRQAIWLALLFITALLLLHEQLLSWRNMFILIIVFFSLEGLLLLSSRQKHGDS